MTGSAEQDGELGRALHVRGVARAGHVERPAEFAVLLG